MRKHPCFPCTPSRPPCRPPSPPTGHPFRHRPGKAIGATPPSRPMPVRLVRSWVGGVGGAAGAGVDRMPGFPKGKRERVCLMFDVVVRVVVCWVPTPARWPMGLLARWANLGWQGSRSGLKLLDRDFSGHYGAGQCSSGSGGRPMAVFSRLGREMGLPLGCARIRTPSSALARAPVAGSRVAGGESTGRGSRRWSRTGSR
jgi:hypothetical protein